jgi:hypothetical protein
MTCARLQLALQTPLQPQVVSVLGPKVFRAGRIYGQIIIVLRVIHCLIRMLRNERQKKDRKK